MATPRRANVKRMLLFIAGAVVIGFFGAILGIRSLGHDVARWHVDPVTAPDPSTPNWYRVTPGGANPSPVFEVAPATLSEALERVVDDQPRTELLADDRADDGTGRVTWVQRSALFGFPDYITVEVVAADGGTPDRSTLAVFSRARLGQSDLGVNEKRVNQWLVALEAELR
jgi:uncharacterized protein (DUF1499 family)